MLAIRWYQQTLIEQDRNKLNFFFNSNKPDVFNLNYSFKGNETTPTNSILKLVKKSQEYSYLQGIEITNRLFKLNKTKTLLFVSAGFF